MITTSAEHLARMEAWATALESGEFTQGFGQLRVVQCDPDEEPPGEPAYCCLGVLTVLAIRAGVKPLSDNEFWCDKRHDHELWCLNGNILSSEVRDWSGLDDCDPDLRLAEDENDPVEQGNVGSPASWVNDDVGADFAEIAYRIRRRYLGAPREEGKLRRPKIDDEE